MSNINENNLIPISVNSLKPGQRLEKYTAADGSVFFVTQGVGAFTSGGKVYVEAQTSFIDDTSTEVVMSVKGNRSYKYTQPLASIAIESIENSPLESEIIFTTGNTFTASVPASIGVVGILTLLANKSYVLSIKNNILTAAEYTPGV